MGNNVANLVPSSINSTLSVVKKPKAFGDQLLKASEQQVLTVGLSIVDQIKKEIEYIILQKIQLDVNHSQNLRNLKIKNEKGILVDDAYTNAINTENQNYNTNKNNLQEQQDKFNQQLSAELLGPYEKAKTAYNTLRKKLSSNKNISQQLKSIVNIKRIRILTKTLVPVLTLVITEVLVNIIDENSKLQTLVDITNKTIEAANASGDPDLLSQATNARNAALNAINAVEQKILNVEQQLQKIQIYINVFNIVINIVISLPIPTAAPPGVGIPVSVITKLDQILQNALKITSGLSTLLTIINSVLQEAIANLENLKTELENINGAIESATTNLPLDQLTIALNDITANSNNFPPYKGYTFAIKEEQNNPGETVSGFKRHYAVALNSNGVVIYTSAYSFTQDPQVLVDQLKLAIDQGSANISIS